MVKIIAFAGSNSSTSINFRLVRSTIGKISGHSLKVFDMSEQDIPMFSEDRERESGYPEFITLLRDELNNAGGLVLSVNEHNSNPSAFCKNLFDWLSRIDRNFLANTKVFLMSTSPGRRGGQSSLAIIEALLPRFGAEVVSTFSLPSFKENFEEESGITDDSLSEEHRTSLEKFLSALD